MNIIYRQMQKEDIAKVTPLFIEYWNGTGDEWTPELVYSRVWQALDDLGNERIELNMCWIPLEDIPNMSIYPPQAKEYIMNLPDEIVYFVHRE